MSGWNLDWLLGPRTWCVVDDGGYYPANIYAIPEARIDSGDIVIVRGLRRKQAWREAEELLPYYAHPVFSPAPTSTAPEVSHD